MKIRLRDVASVIRSKNSGPYELTLDILFKNVEDFERFSSMNIIDETLIARLYKIDKTKVLSIVKFPQAKAIKATIVRPCGSGDLGERDVYGAQQHAPLMNFEWEDR
ncbi:MAG: DUF4387 domain-containing protein [Spirochaetia bacterium]|jgi:hypothetical protein|nr:DUF4387 domain-containing protein [Spirochaetia bacterium]